VTAEETDRLVAEMAALPAHRGWRFTYEYPGYFCYSHPDNDFSVFFTPDWEGDETLPIEVQTGDGRSCEEHGKRLLLPREGRSAQEIFELVRPTLDALLSRRRATAKMTFSVTYDPGQTSPEALAQHLDAVLAGAGMGTLDEHGPVEFSPVKESP
jgi:hypothetical protein